MAKLLDAREKPSGVVDNIPPVKLPTTARTNASAAKAVSPFAKLYMLPSLRLLKPFCVLGPRALRATVQPSKDLHKTRGSGASPRVRHEKPLELAALKWPYIE